MCLHSEHDERRTNLDRDLDGLPKAHFPQERRRQVPVMSSIHRKEMEWCHALGIKRPPASHTLTCKTYT